MVKVITPPKTLVKASDTPWRRILVIGSSGSGKTVLCASAHLDARCYPQLILDFDHSSASVQGLIGYGGEEISVYPIWTYKDLDEIWAYLESGQSPYKSLLVDSISESQILSLFDTADSRMAREPEKSKNQDSNSLQELDFGRSLNQQRRLIRALRSLPMHIFYTALVKTVVLPREGTCRVPNLMGSFSEEIISNMDSCWQLLNIEKTDKQGNKTNVRELILRDYPGCRAKTRVPWNVEIESEIILDGGKTAPVITKLFDMLHVKNPDVTLDSE